MKINKCLTLIISICYFSCKTEPNKLENKPQKNTSITINTNDSNGIKKNIDTSKIKGILKICLNMDSIVLSLTYKYDTITKSIYFPELYFKEYKLENILVKKSTNSILTSIFLNELEDSFMIYRNINIIDTEYFSNKMYPFNKKWVSNSYANRHKIIIEDINYDGYKDLLLYNELESGFSNRVYDLWLFDVKRHTYYRWKNQGGLWDVNKKRKTLTFGYKCGGDCYWKRTLKMIGKDTLYKVISYVENLK